MVANRGDHLFLVVNAAKKEADIARLRAGLPESVTVEPLPHRALVALQGPGSEAALAALAPEVARMRFMDVATVTLEGGGGGGGGGWRPGSPARAIPARTGSRSPCPRTRRRPSPAHLLAQEGVAPAGLGARDSLRLEAGLCLYGHDIDAATSPAEAGLGWAIQKVRRTGGDRAGGFPGAARILQELADGPDRRRVGLLPDGRAPMREGVEIYDSADALIPVGRITSGGFGPTVGAPVAMGHVPAALSAPGTRLYGELRGRRLPVTVATLPFTKANFKR